MNMMENRLMKIVRGLRRPPTSREYKEARIELERLSAPLVAFLVPCLLVTVLFVVTAVGERPSRKSIEIVTVPNDVTEDVPPPPDVPDDPHDNTTEVEIDMPVNIPVDIPKPMPVTTTTPTESHVDPLPGVETLAAVSPTRINVPGGFGGRGAAARRSATGGRGTTGGNNETERAVMKALRWLKKTQQSDGSWTGSSPAAMTGFAVLTYLAHGETPQSPEFGETVKRAVDYLMGGLHEAGGTFKIRGSDGNEYAFLIATYALCETYGMTRNPNVKEAAEKGLARIIRGQSPTGGWDYKLHAASTRDDLSFGGWALQALKAGHMAELKVEGLDAALKKAVRYLRVRAFKNGGFGYCAGNNPNGLTGTGCLALQLLGEYQSKEVRSALDYMRQWGPSWEKHPGGGNPQYYSYYATQCKYQAGMRKGAANPDFIAWKKWNVAMRDTYPKYMVTPPETIPDVKGRPCEIGYWQNKDAYHDRVMGTCLCALQLMVYYRYLPTTSLKATEETPELGEAFKDGSDVHVTVDI